MSGLATTGSSGSPPKNRTNAMTDIDKTNNQIAPIVAESEEERIQSTAFWFAVAAAVGGGIVFLYTIYIVAVGFRYWEELLRDHFAAIIGLPAAAALAFALVVFLRQTDGPIEFEGLGFKFKGAAGQVAMWICLFSGCICSYQILLVSPSKKEKRVRWLSEARSTAAPAKKASYRGSLKLLYAPAWVAPHSLCFNPGGLERWRLFACPWRSFGRSGSLQRTVGRLRLGRTIRGDL